MRVLVFLSPPVKFSEWYSGVTGLKPHPSALAWETYELPTELSGHGQLQQSILQYSISALCHNFQGKRVTALNFPLCDTCHFPSKTAPINNASVVNLLYASQPTHSGESLFEFTFDLPCSHDLMKFCFETNVIYQGDWQHTGCLRANCQK